ncbi:MAG TPA: hypothetical protein VJP78_02865 [Thermoleophilia bacterium]|nr:hypothetical protein [Thermoleophilia bacterium]
MSITLRLLGDLSAVAGAETVEVDGGGWSLRTAVDELVRRYPRLGRELFDERGRLKYTSLLVVDGRPASWPQDKDKPIEDGGELVLTRFFSGG